MYFFFLSGVSLKYISLFAGRIKLPVQVLSFVYEGKLKSGLFLGSVSLFLFSNMEKVTGLFRPSKHLRPFLVCLCTFHSFWCWVGMVSLTSMGSLSKLSPLDEWLFLLPPLIPWILLKVFLWGFLSIYTDILVILSKIPPRGRDCRHL